MDKKDEINILMLDNCTKNEAIYFLNNCTRVYRLRDKKFFISELLDCGNTKKYAIEQWNSFPCVKYKGVKYRIEYVS